MNILGTEYQVIIDTDYCRKFDADGICEKYEKKIYMCTVQDMLESSASSKAKLNRYNETFRHEIIHAYLFEAGLDEYGNDETLVCLLAAKMPQIQKTFEEMGVV